MKKSVEERKKSFIEKANAAHKGKYDYSKVNYTRNDVNVCIICPIHGEFWQRPNNHMNGHGCPKCEGKYRYATSEWIEAAKAIHGDKYDYSLTEYINNHTKVKIICPIHGVFEVLPSTHLSGNNCKKCSYEKLSKLNTLTTEEFIERAHKIHGNKYDYSKVEYEDAHTKVCIICKEHGEFWQKPNSHLSGNGCPKCNQSHLELEIENLLKDNDVNFIQSANSKTFKWLKLQHLDFYLPKYNVAIECQGEQHYKASRFGNCDKKTALENLEKQIERDSRKKRLCEDNGVKLLYYTKYNGIEEDNIETFKDTEKILQAIRNEVNTS